MLLVVDVLGLGVGGSGRAVGGLDLGNAGKRRLEGGRGGGVKGAGEEFSCPCSALGDCYH